MGNDRTLVFVLILALAGCSTQGRDELSSEAASAIQGGTPDDRDVAVVGVALTDEEGSIHRTCSGTLIAPNLVLTAQHCVADTGKSVVCRSSTFGALAPAERVRVTTGSSIWSNDSGWMHVSSIVIPPGAPAVCGRDLALLLLTENANVAPILPRLDAPVFPDESYAAVGYGATHGGATDAGVRRRRDRLHVVCVGDSCSSDQVQGSEWRGDHGVCNGDSGGPAIDATGFVVGVTSRGPAGCERPIYGGIAPHADWIRETATKAAQEGCYVTPEWAWGGCTEPTSEQHIPSRAAVGCAVAPGNEDRGRGALAVAALTLLAALRRRISPRRKLRS